MGSIRRHLLTALPKLALSRLTGVLAGVPLPCPLRGPVYRAFARRYGADLSEIEGSPADHPSLARFFQRSLVAGARPVADAPLVWPCDGRVVTTGPVRDGRIPQVKGMDYCLGELLGEDGLARALEGGTQATLYLAPGDYHRVHAPFAARLEVVRALRGTLFPVNPKAARSVPRLFPRNARHVFRCALPGGRPAAVVMVGALNVGATVVSAKPPCDLRAGDEIGRFGLGSTVVVLLPPGHPGFREVAPETVVRMGRAAPCVS